MIEKLFLKIRRREGRLGALLHDVAKKILWFNVPPISLIYGPLYIFRKGISSAALFLWQKFFNEPMFKSRCKTVGCNLKIDRGFPAISDSLVMVLGQNIHIDGKNTFAGGAVYSEPLLEVGDNSYIGYGTSISVAKRVTIGKDCLIAANVLIGDYNGHPLEPERRHDKITEDDIAPVTIEDNVWIGTGAFIGKGVRIGSGAVVAANAVVIRDVPPRSVVACNPAQVVKEL